VHDLLGRQTSSGTFYEIPMVVERDTSNIELSPEPGRDVKVILRSTVEAPLDGGEAIALRGHVAPRSLNGLRDLLASARGQPVRQAPPPDVADLAKPGDVVVTLSGVPRIEVTICVTPLSGDLVDTLQWRRIRDRGSSELRCKPLPKHASSIVIDTPPMRRLDG
jgi:hypothetical protein